MSIISNSSDFFCEYHFIFQDKSILIETSGNHRLRTTISEEKSLPSESILRKCLDSQVATDWFSEPEYNYTAMVLEDNSPIPSGCEIIPLREFFHISNEKLVMMASRARGLLSWRNKLRFCPTCGSKLENDQIQTSRVCPKCFHEYFPQIEPAVIVAVRNKDKILLVRHVNKISNLWACISGFVEIGETPEQCVAREVQEETGIKVKNIRYVGSQSWPFPDQLMLAYLAEYESGEIVPQASEIAEAAWYDQDKLPKIPPAGSVAYNLIMGLFG